MSKTNNKPYLYYYNGHFTTEEGLKRMLIKDKIVSVTRGTFYLYSECFEFYYEYDQLRDKLYDYELISENEYQHFRKWLNQKIKNGKIHVIKNHTFYACESTEWYGGEFWDCLEALRDDNIVETEEEIMEQYCDTLTENECNTFLKLSDARQSKLAQNWKLGKRDNNK